MSRRGRFGGNDSGRWMQRFLILASTLLVLSFASTSHAYSWMIRHGYAKCASCHTDPMGGETLTGFGRVMSETTLSTRYGQTEPSNLSRLFFGITEPRELRLGGSFRYMTYLEKFAQDGKKASGTTFPMQLDTYGQLTLFDRLRIGGSLGVSRTPVASHYDSAAQVTSNTSGDRPYNLISRTHWIGFDISEAFLVRAGRLNLPFGIRMPEHTMWVRDNTRTDRESQQQHGVALDYSSGRFRGEIMGILGNYQVRPDKYRERGYSLYGEYLLGTHAGIGVSSLITHAGDDIDGRVSGKPVTRQVHGLTGRYAPVEPVVLLAEADVLISDQANAGYVGMLQADYEFAQGFHAMLTGEILDAGRASGVVGTSPGAGEPKLGGWLTFNWFFFTHFDMRMDFIMRKTEQPTFLSQLHWYF